MRTNKNDFVMSFKIRLMKIVLLVSVLLLLYTYSSQETDNNTYTLNKAAFLYESDSLVGVNTGQAAEELGTIWKQKAKEVTDGDKDAVVSTNIINTPTIATFDISDSEQVANIDFVKQNTNLVEAGYTIIIDNKYKFYVDNQEIIKSTVQEILLAYMPDKSYLEYYNSTGKFKPYMEDGKTFTSVAIDNQIDVIEGYVPGSKFIESDDDLLFYLFHYGQNKEYEYISSTKTINSIKSDKDLSDTNFKLNNPGLDPEAITYDGQAIVTNELNPILDVVQTFETTEVEDVEFETVQKIDDSMLKGQFEVTTEGKNGEKEITYQNQIVNGKVISSTEIDEEVVKKPVHRVVTMGEGTVTNSVTVDGNGAGIEPTNITSSGFIWPSASKSVTCEYGGYSGHTGIDIQDYYGAPEYAAKDGIVVTSGWSNYGYGYHVIIDHGNGVKTLYAHQNQQPPVEVGQYVTQGQVVGFEGATGNVTGEHLHFEVQINGTAVNPRPYITNEAATSLGSVCG